MPKNKRTPNGKMPPADAVLAVDVRLLQETENFKERPLEERRLYWHKLASANNTALEIEQAASKQGLERIAVLEAALLAAQANVDSQNEITRETIIEHNATIKKAAAREIELQADIRWLRSRLAEFEKFKALVKTLLIEESDGD
jgi:hypothetical protein